jgi:hypothetical protein
MSDYAFKSGKSVHDTLTSAGWRQTRGRDSRGTTRYEHDARPGHKVIVDPYTNNINHYSGRKMVNSHNVGVAEAHDVVKKLASE